MGSQALGFHHIFISWTTPDSINSSHANDVLRDIRAVRDLGVNLFKSFKPGANKRLVQPGTKKG